MLLLGYVDLKKHHSVRAASKVLLGLKWGLQPGDSTSGISEQLPQRDGCGEVGIHVIICDFGRRENTRNQVPIFPEDFWWSCEACWSQGTGVTTKDFSVLQIRGGTRIWAHKIDSWKHLIIPRSVLPVFPPSTECLISSLNSELLSGVLKTSCCRSTGFNLCRGRRQVPMASANC